MTEPWMGAAIDYLNILAAKERDALKWRQRARYALMAAYVGLAVIAVAAWRGLVASLAGLM